jgi:hypothetical protein
MGCVKCNCCIDALENILVPNFMAMPYATIGKHNEEVVPTCLAAPDSYVEHQASAILHIGQLGIEAKDRARDH